MRYLKATILIGTISTALVTVLFAAGWVSTTPDLILDKIYALKHATTVSVFMQILLMAFFSYAIA